MEGFQEKEAGQMRRLGCKGFRFFVKQRIVRSFVLFQGFGISNKGEMFQYLEVVIFRKVNIKNVCVCVYYIFLYVIKIKVFLGLCRIVWFFSRNFGEFGRKFFYLYGSQRGQFWGKGFILGWMLKGVFFQVRGFQLVGFVFFRQQQF